MRGLSSMVSHQQGMEMKLLPADEVFFVNSMDYVEAMANVMRSILRVDNNEC